MTRLYRRILDQSFPGGEPKVELQDIRRVANTFDGALVLLEGARAGDTGSAETATGYYWGEKRLRPFVERIRARAEAEGDERLAQLAERFLR